MTIVLPYLKKTEIGTPIKACNQVNHVGINLFHVAFENEGRQREYFLNNALCFCGSYDCT